jgi:hypothetical protein
MTKLCTRCVPVVAAIFLSGCAVEKSSNPLSPAVAGPIAGVVISHPNLLEPGQNWELRSKDQPIILLVQNADTNGNRPLTYSFDIAADSEFKNIVFARAGVAPGTDGFTRLQLPDKLAAGTYWWRTRAQDGANSGPYSPVKSFEVRATVVLAPPTLTLPSNGSTIGGLVPEFKIKAGDRSGVVGELEYTLQVANNSSFTSIAAIFVQKESWPETLLAPSYSFLYSKTYYLRVRVRHMDEGGETSNWSAVQTFKTPAPPAAPPPIDPGPGPDPGSVPGSNPDVCNSNDGDDIASCIEAKYPGYLAANVSLSKRKENMAFLRNRMIEHGKCKGLNLGLNMKRGDPNDISYDFIVWRRSGKPDQGVDIASGYDDTKKKLNLTWYDGYGADKSYGHPYYKDYGPVNCN